MEGTFTDGNRTIAAQLSDSATLPIPSGKRKRGDGSKPPHLEIEWGHESAETPLPLSIMNEHQGKGEWETNWLERHGNKKECM